MNQALLQECRMHICTKPIVSLIALGFGVVCSSGCARSSTDSGAVSPPANAPAISVNASTANTGRVASKDVTIAPSATAPSGPGSSGRRLEVIKRDTLPNAIGPLVPKNGIYAAGGGLMSSPWRIVLDYDAKQVKFGRDTKVRAPSFAEMAEIGSRAVGDETLSGVYIADKGLREAEITPSSPVADYSEIVIVCKSDDCVYYNPYGPARAPEAKQLLKVLRGACRGFWPAE
jgi:hypothetical protein